MLTEHKEFPSKSNLYFYSLAQDKCEKVAHFELQSSAFNKVHWAPEGQYCVIAAMGSGELIWARLTDKNVFELLYKDEQVGWILLFGKAFLLLCVCCSDVVVPRPLCLSFVVCVATTCC